MSIVSTKILCTEKSMAYREIIVNFTKVKELLFYNEL
jgi:hypothetical protein